MTEPVVAAEGRVASIRPLAAPVLAVARYAVSRIAQAVVTLLLVYALVFLVVTALPGDPISNRVNDPDSGYTPQVVAQLQAYYGLDRPLWERFGAGLLGFLTGDLGLSLRDARPVAEHLADAVGPTLQLAGAALLVTVLLAVGWALLALYGPWRSLRALAASAPSVVNALPVYLVALVLVHVFSFQLKWVPLVGADGPAVLVLPTIVLGITISPSIAQVFISSLEEARGEGFVGVARARGIRELRLFFTHLIPVTATTNLTVLGLVIGALLSGAVVTETVFSRPGLGTLLSQSVTQHDLPVLQAVVLLVAAIYIGVNLVVDLLTPLIDPRIRLAGLR